LQRECYQWDRPIFEHAPVSGVTRRLFAAVSFFCLLAPGRLSCEALHVEQLKPHDSISVFIEEDSEPVSGCFADGLGDMLESDIEVAFGTEVHGYDFSRELHVICSFNLGQDLL